MINLKDINGMEEENLINEIKKSIEKDNIKIIFLKRTVLVFINDIFKYKGVFNEKSYKLIKDRKDIFLYKFQNSKIPQQISENINEINDKVTFEISEVNEWIRDLKKRLKIPNQIERKLWSNAKDCCQMCYRDLSEHIFKKDKGNYGQIAHIEAIGFDGPRSNQNDLENCNEIENLMLLCYDCHRLIDFINPEKYTVNILKDIKNKQEEQVKKILSTLMYKKVIPVCITTKLNGDEIVEPTYKEIVMALSEKELSIEDMDKHRYLFLEKRKSHNEEYWSIFFKKYQEDSILLKSLKERNKDLALFIYNGISELIFLGNRFGDTVNLHLFQKHRNKNSEFNWSWPNENDKSGNDIVTFNIEEFNMQKNTDECLFLVTLTADINVNELPENLYNKGYVLPTIKITSNNLNNMIIAKEENLKTVTNIINQQMKDIKDKLKKKKIHIVVIAPTLINFNIGRAIQSKYQGEIICYEKNTENKYQEPTIVIEKDIVYFYKNKNIKLDM